jgi:hypothetical protein
VLVVVALLEQPGHVEQPPVQLARGQVGHHLVREHVQVVADGLGPDPALGRPGRVTSAASRPPPTSVTWTTSPVMRVTVRIGAG